MIRVFLVEDEFVIREAIQKIVPWAEYGFELIGEAKDGEMALPLIRKTKPDVLITDIRMPFMDGLTLSRLVKKELPDTRVVIVSGHDDFEYARQAISLGVEQYLLKPISKSAFLEVLEGLRAKFRKENEQKLYYRKFENEIRAYEKNARREFFETLVSENADLQKLYVMAEKLQLDITAQSYNLILFAAASREDYWNTQDGYSQIVAETQSRIDEFCVDHPGYLLFRNQQFSYAILVKGDVEETERLTQQGVSALREIFERQGESVEWFVCTGKCVERISMLAECYRDAMTSFAYRYLGYHHVFSREQLLQDETEQGINFSNIDMKTVGRDSIRSFLCNAMEDEVEGFVSNYIELVGKEALRSRMFQNYVLLNMHFCTLEFAIELGYEREKLDEELKVSYGEHMKSRQDMREEMVKILRRGIILREKSVKGKRKSVVSMAVSYMKEHYTDDALTLNEVARAANVSANHFSALFSQEMKQTFIEYLTTLRMNRAKELLRCSDKRSGEIALEVGYKDPHYFSFLFKKTQGCTPSEYRSGGEGQR